MTASDADTERARLDRWLWAARFFKTRSLAADAVDAGHVRINDQRTKPAREVRVGDRIAIHTPSLQIEVTVQGLSVRRGPAPIAQGLYDETAASREARVARQAEKASADRDAARSRPTKRDRRKLDGLRGGH